MEVLFAGLKNNNYQGKKKKTNQKTPKPALSAALPGGGRDRGWAGTAPPAGPRPRRGGKSPKLPRSAPFFRPRVFFCPAVKHPAGQRSPFPSAPRSASLPAFPKIEFIPRIYSTKHPQPPRRRFSSVPTKPCAGGRIFFPPFPYFPPPLFFSSPNQSQARQKPLGKTCEKAASIHLNIYI